MCENYFSETAHWTLVSAPPSRQLCNVDLMNSDFKFQNDDIVDDEISEIRVVGNDKVASDHMYV